MSHTTTHSVTLRMAAPADALPLLRLAQLDSSRVPVGPVLLAERGDHLVAARSLADGHTVADPFAPTGDVVDLLVAHATRVAAPHRRRAPWASRQLAPRPG